MKETDLAWAAGLVDAEGCITLSKTKRSIGLKLIVEMSCQKTILHLYNLFKCGQIYIKENKNRKNTTRFEAYNPNAIQIIKMIRPYLITKSRQAILAEEFYEKCTGNYNQYNKVPIEIEVLREVLLDEMKHLNHRGNYDNLLTCYKSNKINDSNFMAYLAGLIDGDGTITFKRTGNCGGISLKLSIISTCKIVLEVIQNTIKMGHIRENVIYNKSHKLAYEYSIIGNKAASIIDSIKNYTITRDKQVELALEFNQKCMAEKYSKQNKVPEDIIVLRQVMKDEMMILNKRGIN